MNFVAEAGDIELVVALPQIDAADIPIRERAERAGRGEIACVVVETDGDDDLGDKMWAANLKHGAQYTRAQR